MSHKCFSCREHEIQAPFRWQGSGDGPELQSSETTYTDGDDAPFFAAGYSAREIAVQRARESSKQVYVNNISRDICHPDVGTRVLYAVASSPVYTLCPADEHHPKIYRAYWPPL